MAIIALTMPLNPSNPIGSVIVDTFNPFVIYIPQFLYQMISGEAGVQLQLAVNSPTFTTNNILSATTIKLTITEPNGTVTRVLSMTSDSTGLLALRTLLVTDFPYGGNYTAQLEADFADGTILKSAKTAIIVGA